MEKERRRGKGETRRSREEQKREKRENKQRKEKKEKKRRKKSKRKKKKIRECLREEEEEEEEGKSKRNKKMNSCTTKRKSDFVHLIILSHPFSELSQPWRQERRGEVNEREKEDEEKN